MKSLSEGRKMFLSVMVTFVIYAIIFILFEDYDRAFRQPFKEASDWHLLLFSVIIMTLLAWMLHRYAQSMDQRISREQMAKESRLRRELTQNISHELKTPVASILGYTDTILDNPDLDSQTLHQFIVRTNSQAHRLTSLLQDLSTLNRMDYAADMINKERTDISAIVAEITEETALSLSQRQMTLRNCLPQGIIIKGDPSLIYSIFRNLFNNSMIYAGKDTTIEITAEDRGTEWHFTFRDDGQGIDSEHLPRLFERFYRIDKGRSRAEGGTGLGLAIVKNAVMLHGGTITAKSQPGEGLQFDFTLKK